MEHDRILGYFLEEASEHLNTIEQGLRKLPETVSQPASIRELFRAAHSIKGSAAMLGLNDVRQVGDRFEANFKLLKDQPQIAVDNRLQALFLDSFSFLRAAINEVKTSNDPYRRDPNAPDPVGDPVFEELKGYLQQLLAQANSVPGETHPREPQVSPDQAVEQVFGGYVTRKLTEIASLCLQPDTPEIRAQIQKICQKLGNLGENFEFLEWTNLFSGCRLAIANPHNSLTQLGESMKIAIEQAQSLVLTDRHHQIVVTPDLQALIDPQQRSSQNFDRNVNLDPVTQTEHHDSQVDFSTRSNASTEPLPIAPERPSPVFSSITSSIELFDIAASDNFINLMADSESELNVDLNDLLDSIDGDVPSDGTWMKDDDFFNTAKPSGNGASSSDNFYQQIFEPSGSNLPANALVDLDLNLSAAIDDLNYDEETFFTPDLGGVEDRDPSIGFWSDTQLAAQSHPLPADLDFPDRAYQLHPDPAPTFDLEIPAPDFSLDRPMSELFATAAIPSEPIEIQTPPATSETIAPATTPDVLNASITDALNSDRLPVPDSIDLIAASNHDFYPDLQAPAIVANPDLVPQIIADPFALDPTDLDDLANQIVGVASPEQRSGDLDNFDRPELTEEEFGLETNFSEESSSLGDFSTDPFSIADRAMAGLDLNSVDLSHGSPLEAGATSDVLYLEELNSYENPNSATSEAIDADELTQWDDRDLDPDRVDCFSNLSIDGSDLAPISDSALDRNLVDLSFLDNFNDAPDVANFETDLLVSNEDSIATELPELNSISVPEISETDVNLFTNDLANFGLSGDESVETDLSLNHLFSDLDAPELGSQVVEANDSISMSLIPDSDNAVIETETQEKESLDLNFADSDLDTVDDRNSIELANIDNLGDLNLAPVVYNNSNDDSSFDLKDLGDLNYDALPENNSIESSNLDALKDLNWDLANNSLSEEAFDLNNFGDLNFDTVENNNQIESTNLENCENFNLTSSFENNNSSDESFNLNDFADLDIAAPPENKSIESSSLDDLNGLNLDAVENNNSSDESFNLNNFDGLDLNILEQSDLDIGLEPAARFEDLSDLSFNLDEFSSNLVTGELTDLEISLDGAAERSTLDLGNLDTLLGLTAVGVGGAILANSGGFEDLDNLVGTPTSPVTPAEDLDDLDRLLATPTPAFSAAETKADKKTADRRSKQRTFEQTMRVSVRHLDNLNNLVGELVVNRNTLEQDQTRMRQFVEKLLSEVQRLNEVGKRMQDLYERSLMENSLVASRQQSKPNAAPSSIPANLQDLEQTGTLIEYDPLEMDRFTPIHLLSQKMIELTVRIRESTADIEFVVDGSTEVTRTLRQITGQLQEDLTKSRMVPFAQTADRLQRGVRENGLRYGKQVELTVEGRDTPIDKVILESLSDPLIHMVNNAIAHGIESPEQRQSVGKPIEGKITIRALHQGNQTIISIADDGGGINTEQVKAKAIEKGIITVQQAAAMSKTEAYELLFLPSFSTKDQADELAGRGVGMDVVRNSLNDIRGTITTESELGVGTTFTIRLPLALSIAKALITVNEKVNIAFPMDGIEDTQNVSPEQIQTNSEGQKSIFWRDGMMPFKPLSDLLGFNRPLSRNNFYSAQEDDSDLVSILILRSDGNLIAVQVDKIVSDQEIAIKPLQGPAPKPLGIAGATVLGDGRIVPIADVMELIDLASGKLIRPVSTQWTNPISTPTVEMPESMVLIVDDSITVRELLSLTFKRAGYRVEQARDGQEAWDKLRAGLPCDIVFCDIEMPRMDGLEFLSRIQKDPALKKVPVAMLTSRGSDRHRQIASQLGASGYFIKPYLEEALLEAAKRMIKGEVLAIV